jgi:hypothetical protein
MGFFERKNRMRNERNPLMSQYAIMPFILSMLEIARTWYIIKSYRATDTFINPMPHISYARYIGRGERMYGCCGGYGRSYFTSEEKVEMLKEYRESLESELKGVSERIKELEKAS